jgi:hypothetical protein
VDHKIHAIFDSLCEKYYINHQKFPDPEQRIKRCYTLVKWGYSVIYYTISTAAAYILLFNTDVLPAWLGGSGSCMNTFAASPKIPAYTWSMELFYVLQFGKHFSRAFGHCFIRPEGNYFEYALHHGLSTFLILFSYMMNYWLVGVMVLLVHDVSDLFLTLSRAYREAKNRREWLLQSFYLSTFFVWIGSRIVVFTGCCIYPSLIFVLYQIPNDQSLTQSMKYILD